jgi:hypothetical protein
MKRQDFRMINLVFILIIPCLAACTYSITQVHTEGVASDVVDETQTAQPDVSPTLQVPLK